MPSRRTRKDDATVAEAAVAEAEKHVDATDEEQSSDDEAPEEVSTAAATALAGHRRKAEQQARQAAPGKKRKRARSSKARKGADGGGDGDAEDDGGEGGLELPSDLLMKVKSGGLQRIEADVLAARRDADDDASAEAAALVVKRAPRAADIPRSDNFRLVVLDGDDGGAADGASSKAQAAGNAKNFLRERIGSQKRVSHTLFKARKRLGPSPNF